MGDLIVFFAGTRKSVQFESADNDDKPILGLRCMLYVLQNVNNKKMIFRQNLSQVSRFQKRKRFIFRKLT